MKRKLKKFFKDYNPGRPNRITLEHIKTIFTHINKKDSVVFHIGSESLIISYDAVELGTTDGEWFHTVIQRTPHGIIVVPDMKDYLLNTIKHWNGNLVELYEAGLNKIHPLYLPDSNIDDLDYPNEEESINTGIIAF